MQTVEEVGGSLGIMDFMKLTAVELRKVDERQLRETEDSVRRKIHDNRMEFYLSASVKTGQQQNLRKSLARVMTVLNERRRQVSAKGGKK